MSIACLPNQWRIQGEGKRGIRTLQVVVVVNLKWVAEEPAVMLWNMVEIQRWSCILITLADDTKKCCSCCTIYTPGCPLLLWKLSISSLVIRATFGNKIEHFSSNGKSAWCKRPTTLIMFPQSRTTTSFRSLEEHERLSFKLLRSSEKYTRCVHCTKVRIASSISTQVDNVWRSGISSLRRRLLTRSQ